MMPERKVPATPQFARGVLSRSFNHQLLQFSTPTDCNYILFIDQTHLGTTHPISPLTLFVYSGQLACLPK